MDDKSISYCIYDLETTGLSIYEAGIVQIAFLIIDELDGISTVVAKGCFYCKPEDINFDDAGVQKALSINKLTKEFILRQVDEETILANFFSIIKAFQIDYIIGQNHIAYDNEILYNRSLKYDIENDCLEFLKKDHIDTKLYHKAMFPGEKNSLEYMCEKFGITQINAHDALCDVECTWEVFNKLRKADSCLDVRSLKAAKEILIKY